MTQLNKNDGIKIIKFLEDNLKIELPKTGLLAGQAVCSAILYLYNRLNEFHVNDIDIFHMATYDVEHFIRTENALPKIGKGKRSQLELYIEDKEKKKLWLERRAREREMYNSGEISIEEYLSLIIQPNYTTKCSATIFNTAQTSYSRSNYKILRVYRRELLNHVIVEGGCLDINNIIFGFDINCTQIGVNLATGQLIYSRGFLEFFNTLVLKSVSLDRPHHSLIRYLSKRKEFNYQGNDEFETMYYSIAMHMTNPDVISYIDERLAKVNDKSVDVSKYSELTFNRFGQTYMPKLDGVRKSLMDFDIKIEQIENKFKSNTPIEIMKNNQTSELGSLTPRVSLSDCIDIDKEIDQVIRDFGSSVLGANRYIFSKAIKIVDNNRGQPNGKKVSFYSLPSIKDILKTKQKSRFPVLDACVQETVGKELASRLIGLFSRKHDSFIALNYFFREYELETVFNRLEASLKNDYGTEIPSDEIICTYINNISLVDYDEQKFENEKFIITSVTKYSELNKIREKNNEYNESLFNLYLSAVLNYNFVWEIYNKKDNVRFVYSFAVNRCLHSVDKNYKRSVHRVWKVLGSYPLEIIKEQIYDTESGKSISHFERSDLWDITNTFKEWLSDNHHLTKMINCRI